MSEVELKELLRKRSAVKTKVTNFRNKLNEFKKYRSVTTKHVNELSLRLSRFENAFNDFDLLRDKIESLTDDSNQLSEHESLDGRAILKEGEIDKELLKEGSRRKIAQLVIHQILEKHPKKQIRSEEFQTIATEIVEIFPKENVNYGKRENSPVVAGPPVAQFHGRLLNISSSPTATLTVDEIKDDANLNEDITWLRNNVDPWKTVEEKWKETAGRRDECFQSGKGTIADNFKNLWVIFAGNILEKKIPYFPW
ncbi:hypothetical protein MSG28_012412 [Choristoneura fumiferana]|uniref:Uncharacterized protein n=1 Tax=Choristoneura fumiferana TaxID=7141 RepID=A0ACC0KD01_CHOFU|nr:hypothetical protein MSG28_012412 [Choristoneura fumiferana]